VDDWKEPIDWTGQPTSLLAVVAGDVSSDLDRTVYELEKISKCYRQVMFIDGDLEHQGGLNTVSSNQNYLSKKIKRIKNCTSLHEQVVLMNHVAFIAANLWWSPGNSTTNISDDHWIDDMRVLTLHHEDLDYLRTTVQRLQDSPDINNLVLISHTVPNRELILEPVKEHMATDASDWVEMEDFQNKISNWCFGHWPRPLKFQLNHCEYVSNPKGKPSDSLGLTYHPQRVIV
jgi:hypothetical protein